MSNKESDRKSGEPNEPIEDEFTEARRPLMHMFIHVWRLHGHVLDKVTVHQGIYKTQMKMLGHIFIWLLYMP